MLYNRIDYICHVGSSQDYNSIVRSRLIAGGKDTKEGRQTVFFTAVDPVNQPQKDEPYDATRVVPYRTEWKVYQNAENWINLKSAQEKRPAFWQTRSNAIILHDPVTADCLEKVLNTIIG